MYRASLIFLFFMLFIMSAVYSTAYYGFKTGELDTKIINPLKSAAENFANNAAKVPFSDITPIPIPVSTYSARLNQITIQTKNFIDEINRASKNWVDGNDAQVIEYATKALSFAQTDRDKAYAHYWIGLGYYRQNNLDKAEMEEHTALQLYPGYAAPYTTLSAISISRSDFNTALTLAQKAAELDPTYPWAYNNQGIALVELGRKAEGLEMFKKAIQLAPDSYIFRDNLTRAQNTH